MYVYASERSERGLRKFWHFHILKLIFPSIFLLVLHILCLRNIFNFRCQITSAYIYNQCSFRLLLMVWCYINDSIPTNTNIEQMYICERAERASLEHFGFFTFLSAISFNILSVHQILCRYKMTCLSAYMYRQISKCTDKFSKLRKSIIGGGGAVAPPPPAPLWLR